jgi:hypothetical protein
LMAPSGHQRQFWDRARGAKIVRAQTPPGHSPFSSFMALVPTSISVLGLVQDNTQHLFDQQSALAGAK